MSAPQIAVVGSVNLDIVGSASVIPREGETITGAELAEYPGGKGANQALAAQRMGADVQMIGAVGDDANAGKALALLNYNGVDLSAVKTSADKPTGVALIHVGSAGENQIMVAPGANLDVRPSAFTIPPVQAVIAQLEIPFEAIIKVVAHEGPLSVINLAPVQVVPQSVEDIMLEHADILIVNEVEADFYGDSLFRPHNRVVKTLGAEGAELYEGGMLTARAVPPKVAPVDTTGCGDCFVGSFVTALLEGRSGETALQIACTAGALAATKAGAQSSLPSRAEVDALYKQTYSR